MSKLDLDFFSTIEFQIIIQIIKKWERRRLASSSTHCEPLTSSQQHLRNVPLDIIEISSDEETSISQPVARVSQQRTTTKADPIKKPDIFGIKCNFESCSAAFKTVSSFVEHLNAHHTNNTSFSCYLCKKQLETKDYLRRHIKSRHITSKRTYPCSGDNCKKTYTQQHNLIYHYSNVHMREVINAMTFIHNKSRKTI